MATHSRHRRRSTGGFTLVEVSIVVVMVGILSAIAVVGYIRYRRQARMAEATNLISMIKAEQESYKNERGLYVSVSETVDSFYPAPTPGAFATMWGGPCANCLTKDGWESLPIKPDGPVMYGYATVAGVGEDIAASSSSSSSSSSSGGGKSKSGMMKTQSVLGTSPTDSTPVTIENSCSSISTTQPFYVIKAQGDTDGDHVACTVLALSCSNTLILTNEGE
jgi:prepilin-type N-terminal cleavage/methylation domain-containing protein